MPSLTSHASSSSNSSTQPLNELLLNNVNLNDNRKPQLINELHISNLSKLTKFKLSSLLDPLEPMGRDWCMLGVRLGLTDKLPKLDPHNLGNVSPTWMLLNECIGEKHCTIKFFLEKLYELARDDAIDIVLKTAPLIKIFPLKSINLDDYPLLLTDEMNTINYSGSKLNIIGSQASSTNLSR